MGYFHERVFAAITASRSDKPEHKLFEQDDRDHFTTVGHDNVGCAAKQGRIVAKGTNLADWLADHEYFDGERVFHEPWPCADCIPTESLPAVDLGPAPAPEPKREPDIEDMLRSLDAAFAAKGAPAPQVGPPADATLNEPIATPGQVGKLMILFKQANPNVTPAQKKAEEARVSALTKKAATAEIDAAVNGTAPLAPPVTIPATSLLAVGATVVNDTGVQGIVFWAGTSTKGKNIGQPRYGIEYMDAFGAKQRVFTDSGWRTA